MHNISAYLLCVVKGGRAHIRVKEFFELKLVENKGLRGWLLGNQDTWRCPVHCGQFWVKKTGIFFFSMAEQRCGVCFNLFITFKSMYKHATLQKKSYEYQK